MCQCDQRNRGRREVYGGLLLEEVLESLAGIQRASRRSFRRRLRGLRVGRWRGVLLYRRAEFVERAGIFCILRRDALGNRLRALELGAAVEEPALFAAVQLKIALGTLSTGIEARDKYRAAVRAPRPGDRADHAGCARAEMIVRARPALGRFAVMRPLFLFLLFRIAVAAMAILAIHKRLRTTEQAQRAHASPRSPAKDQPGATLSRVAPWFVSNRVATLGSTIGFFPGVSSGLPMSESRRWDNYVCSALGVRSQAGK